jgi:probable HAF family extracellular repeat protein
MKMKNKTLIAIILGLLMAIAPAASLLSVAGAPSPYADDPVVLPIPEDARYAVPRGISNNNPPVIAGVAQQDYHEYAIFWLKDSTGQWNMYELETPSSTTQSAAEAVNDNGWIVGSILETGTRQAWLWKIDLLTGAILSSQGLGFLDEGTMSSARAVNNQGEVVGVSNIVADPAYAPHAFCWKQRTGMVDIGVYSGDDNSAANDLTNKAIVGTSVSGSGATEEMRAVIWSKTNTISALPNPTDVVDTQARKINQKGTILGIGNMTIGAIDYQRAVAWTPTKFRGDVTYTATNLGIPGTPGLYDRSWGAGLNDAGNIVIQATSGSTSTMPAQAFVLINLVSSPIPLNPIDSGDRSFAYAINNQGIVIGTSDATTAFPVPVIWLP